MSASRTDLAHGFPNTGPQTVRCSYAVALAARRDWKHSRQNTGRPCVGLKGTVVSLPHAEQLVVVSTRSLAMIPPPAEGREARLALHPLHRFGSFLKFLSAKKSCSPAVQTNSAPQFTHLSDLSWNSIGPASHQPARRPSGDGPVRPHGTGQVFPSAIRLRDAVSCA